MAILPHSKFNRAVTRQTYPIFIGYGKKPVFLPQHIDKLAATINNPKVKFYAVPTEDLVLLFKKAREIRRPHPLLEGMARKIRENFILGAGVLIDTMMIVRWIMGELDERNKYILSNCDIIVKGLSVDDFWRV